MPDIKVDFSALGGGASGISTTFTALTSTLTDLEGQLQPMLTTWSGAAQEAYRVQKAKWDAAAEGLAAVLNRMGQAVSQAEENYTTTESSNQSLWT